MSQRPLIIVAGETGTGKSALAVSLAQRAHELGASSTGEVINADSMQVYVGLDVLTNKATAHERRDVPHHLMSFVEPGREYRVDRFAEDARREIDRMHDRGVLPIVAGGTAYYVQSLLFPDQLVGDRLRDQAQAAAAQGTPPSDLSTIAPDSILGQRLAQLGEIDRALLALMPALPNISSVSSFAPGFPLDRLPSAALHDIEHFAMSLYTMLQTLDPATASRWHWRDIRKVRRCLEICVAEGRPASEVWAAQKLGYSERGETGFQTLLIWLTAARSHLDAKLDARVDTMVESGILDEVRDLRAIETRLRADASSSVAADLDYSSGIFQAIGYRELCGYLEPPCTSCGLPETHQRLESDAARLAHAVERTKISTRQYARRQSAWLRRKLLPAVVGSDVLVYPLDATRSPLAAAERLVSSFLAGRAMPEPADVDPMAAAILAGPQDVQPTTMVRCDTCTTDPQRPVLIAASALAAHQGSPVHRKRLPRRVHRDTS